MPEVTLEFISKQLERFLQDNAALREDVTVLTAMVMRLEANQNATLIEVRALSSKLGGLENRVAKLEDAQH